MPGAIGVIDYRVRGTSTRCICVPRENKCHRNYPDQYNMFAGSWEKKDGTVKLKDGRTVLNQKNTAIRETREEGFPMHCIHGNFHYLGDVHKSSIYAFKIKNGTSRKQFVKNSETTDMNFFPIQNFYKMKIHKRKLYMQDVDSKWQQMSSFNCAVLHKFAKKLLK